MFKDFNDLSPNTFPKLLERIESFHGHLCPGIAYGLRVAVAGLNSIRADQHSKLTINCFAQSCVIDAIQIITGCTIGNGRLKVEDKKQHEYVFWNAASSKGICLELTKVEFQDEIKETEAQRQFNSGDRSPDVLAILEKRLNRKVAYILSAKEECILQKKPVTSPFVF